MWQEEKGLELADYCITVEGRLQNPYPPRLLSHADQPRMFLDDDDDDGTEDLCKRSWREESTSRSDQEGDQERSDGCCSSFWSSLRSLGGHHRYPGIYHSKHNPIASTTVPLSCLRSLRPPSMSPRHGGSTLLRITCGSVRTIASTTCIQS